MPELLNVTAMVTQKDGLCGEIYQGDFRHPLTKGCPRPHKGSVEPDLSSLCWAPAAPCSSPGHH